MYELDQNAARKADQTGSMIKELGKYIGRFTQAEDITAPKGTKGVAFRFEARDGRKAQLSLYTVMANGDKIMGYETLMAIMTCLSLRNIKPVPGTVTYWDNEARAEASRPGKVFHELCGKDIGLLLETEDYTKQDGNIGTRMVLKAAFQATTELTATEILDRKTQPEQLEKMVLSLRHRPIKSSKPTRQATPAGGGSGLDDMDDDIPF